MFQSAGLFRDVSCPFFLYGLCERPYCHFKHSKHEEAKVRKELEEKVSQKKDTEEDSYALPTTDLQSKLQSIEESIQSEKRKLSSSENNGSDCKSKYKNNLTKNKPTGTPEYNPTPIKELKKKKQEGKFGVSKYELALLDGPSSAGEYDPASNFIYPSANGKSKDYDVDDLPDYAKDLQHGVKRSAEEIEEDDENPLAKIPKFVSVDYTPAVIEAEFSDDEANGENEKGSSDGEGDNLEDSPVEKLPQEKNQKKKCLESTPNEDKSGNSLPLEFTEDGFVKTVPVQKTMKVEKNNKIEFKNKAQEMVMKNENIFSLFKEEFDKELEYAGDKIAKPKSERKTSSESVTEKDKGSDSSSSKSSHHHHHSSSKHKDRHKDSSSKVDTPKKSDKYSSHHNSDHKHRSDSKDSHKDKGSKHNHSSSKHSDQSHKNTHKSADHKDLKTSKSKDKHSSRNETTSKHSHKSSSSSMTHKDSSNKHNRERTSSSDRKSSSKSSVSESKKKKIVDLDFDLFGDHIDLGQQDKRSSLDDEFSDLDKYFSDEDPFDECLRIFNEENKPSTSTADKKKQKKPSQESAPPTVIGKKRTALKPNDSNDKKKVAVDKPKVKPSPAQVMMNRYKMMQEKVLQAQEEAKEKVKAKVREKSASNAAKAAAASSTPSSSLASANAAFGSYMANRNKKTTAITVTKGSKRKAHTPTVAIEKLKRPVVEISTSSKVATNVRQRYLNIFIDECLKLCPTDKQAFDRGKEEEEAVFNRATNKKLYLNIAVNTVKKLRTEIAEKDNKTKKGTPVKSVMKLSHNALLDGAGAKKTSFTVNRSGGAVKLREEDFTGPELYKRLQPYILTEEQLRENNFPRPYPDKGGAAMFYKVEETKQKGSTKGYEKLCLRCGRVFEVYPNGKYPVKEECVYHWGKAWKKKIAGSIETRYTCCSGDLASEGCQVSRAHVHETNKQENMTGYMKTIPCSPPIDGDYGVYALDCEMVYTTMGIELARVTVVGADQEPAYEALVRPDNPVVDFNTRFSGITEEDLEGVSTSLRDVQAVLLSLFSDKTILIGHSLESDLLALKLIHSTVVDTSVVFPHKMGPPLKRALRNLMIDYLKKIIQDDVLGHDSQEDAVACLQLMQYRLKEDARREARRLSS